MRLFTGFGEAVVVDVETTGLDPESDRIISISLIRTNFGNLKNDGRLHMDTMDAMVNPGVKIPKEATRIHGIRDSDVQHQGGFEEAAQQIRDFIGNLPIIAHNASFDKKFLNAELKRAGVKSLHGNRSYCTMRRYQEFNHGIRKGSRLEDVAIALDIGRRSSGTHDSSEDAGIALKIAGIFYMLDNGIKMPGGTPNPPGFSALVADEKQKPSGGCLLAIALIFLVLMTYAVSGGSIP